TTSLRRRWLLRSLCASHNTTRVRNSAHQEIRSRRKWPVGGRMGTGSVGSKEQAAVETVTVVPTGVVPLSVTGLGETEQFANGGSLPYAIWMYPLNAVVTDRLMVYLPVSPP